MKERDEARQSLMQAQAMAPALPAPMELANGAGPEEDVDMPPAKKVWSPCWGWPAKSRSSQF